MASHMADISVYVLRPGEAGQALVSTINALGVSSCHMPALDILPLSAERPEEAFDYYIFISPTAVKMSFAVAPDWLPSSANLIAVGSGTAKALQRYGHAEVIVPEHYNSEGLLALAELSSVTDKRVLIVKGVGGRKLLQETLSERGADCQSWSVYRREPAIIADDQWQTYQEAGTRLLTCASIETLTAFETQRAERDLPRPEQIFVASDRIADHAQRVGYTEVIPTGGATNQHFITAISHYLAIG